MSRRPKVSAVIPTYNDADYLPRAIQSVNSQTYSDIEIIVVDDGSDDKTKELMENRYSSIVRYFEHKQNKGGSAARNTGIRHANGEYIAFLDADDEWKPKKIEEQVNTLEDRSDDWVAAYCGVVNKSEDEEESESIPIYSRIIYSITSNIDHFNNKKEGGSELIPSVLCNRFFLGGASTILIRTQTAREMDGFDEDFDRLQDMEFLIRILKNGSLAYVKGDLVINHYTGFKVDAKKSMQIKKQYLNKYSKDVIELEMEGTSVTSIHRFDIARRFFLEGKLLKGLYYLRKSKLAKPQSIVGIMIAIVIGMNKNLGSNN